MTTIQKVNRITLLIVLIVCTAIKAAGSFNMFRPTSENSVEKTMERVIERGIVTNVKHDIPQISNKRIVASVNVVMAIRRDDGKMIAYLLDNNEVEALKTLNAIISEEHFDKIVEYGAKTSKKDMMKLVSLNINRHHEIASLE